MGRIAWGVLGVLIDSLFSGYSWVAGWCADLGYGISDYRTRVLCLRYLPSLDWLA